MNITHEHVDELNSIVTIQLKKDDYVGHVEQSIKEEARKAKIPGFRSGKVPASHIKKLYGKHILVDQVNNLLSTSLNEYIETNQIQILGNPLPIHEDQNEPKWDFEDDFEFKYELGLTPVFDFNLSKSDKVHAYSVVLDDETLESRITNLRRAYGKMSNPELSENGDVLYGEFEQLSQDGSPYPGGINNTASLKTDLVVDKEIKEKLVGLSRGSQVVLDLQKTFGGNAHLLSHLLKIDEESANQLSSPFMLTVKNVNRLESADLDEEFFLKIYPSGEVTTEEVFRERVAEEVNAMIQEQSNKRLDVEILDYVVQKFPSELPDAFLKKWLRVSNEDRFSPEQIESEYADFQKKLKWTLIENKILKEHNMEPTADDVFERAKQKVSDYFKLQQQETRSDVQVQDIAVSMVQNKEQARQLLEELRAKKTFEYLRSVLSFEKEEIAYSDFLKL